nr:hypothetical protein CFP56_30073 [Quercus suber]
MNPAISPSTSIANTSHYGSGQDYILRLPTEIMVLIAEHTLPEDLPALRLACADINSKISDTFAKVYFTEKAFMLPHIVSMNALVAISEHPVLGRRMKKVSLHMTIVKIVNSQYHYDTGRPIISQLEYQQKHQKLRNEQMNSVNYSWWRSSLERALLNLAKSKREIVLEVVCPTRELLPSTDRITACGIRAMKRDYGLNDMFKSAWDFQHTGEYLNYAHLLKLVRAADMSVIGLERTDHTASIIASSFVRPSVFRGKAFGQLKVLGLYLGETRLAGPVPMENIIKALRVSPTLESVTFYAAWSRLNEWKRGRPELSQGLLVRLEMPSLHEIKLYRFSVDPDDLMCFVRRHRKTLHTVIIQGVESVLPSQLETLGSQVAELVDSEHAHIEIEQSAP